MADIIDLTKYLKEKEAANVDKLALRLAELIDDLDIKDQYEMYMNKEVDGIYGLPFVYTISQPEITSQVKTLSDVTDVLTTLTITLDDMGHANWANQISDIVGEMFASGSSREC